VSSIETRVALRYMQSRHGSRLLSLISLIAVTGLAVGVSALVVVIGVMNGMQNDYRDKILIGSPDIRVLPFGGDLVMYDWQPVAAEVAAVPGVVTVAPFIEVTAMLVGPHTKYRSTAQVVGLPTDTGTAAATQIRSQVVSGAFEFRTEVGENGAVVGSKLADRLGVREGVDSITVVTTDPDRMDPLTGNLPYLRGQFLVTGVFETGMYEYDNQYVYVSLGAAQELMQFNGAVTGLEVRTPTRDHATAVAERIRDTVGISVRALDWKEQNRTLFSALKLEKVGMTLILTLIILVAAFNIVGTLTMVVHDKTREIGILRAMGMPSRVIHRLFLLQGIIIGSVGTVIGLVLGLFVTYLIDVHHLISLPPDIYFIDHLPASTEPLDVALIAIGSMVIAVLATQGPARQAAALDPVEAIRHE
jgi:lipoprotein-releasing system permease protein